MSQVKNLRAMFENKADSSPPDRGRSPAVGVSISSAVPAGPSGAGSPRPLSKVRTNFVAIEKDGRMGLRRDHSDESSLSRRRMSTETNAESISTFPDKPATVSDDGTRPTRRPFVSEPIPESPPTVPLSQGAAGPVSDKLATSPVKQPGDDGSSSALGPVGPEDTMVKESISTSSTCSSLADESTEPSGASAPAKLKSTPPSAVSAKPATRTAAKKTFTGTRKRGDGKSAVKTSEKLGARRDAASAARTATSASWSKPVSSTVANLPRPSRAAGHGDSGFVKPKPKSPTKPVNLPPSLTAPTASSVSKGTTSRQSLSRQSGSLQNANASSHPPIRESRRQGPATSRPKPSVGPPPIKPSQSGTAMAKRRSHVDEGFLARMMRPTQASSSKTSDKAPPTTPPKKIATRPLAAATVGNLQQEANARKPAVAANAAARKPRASRSQQSDARRPRDPVVHGQAKSETTEAVASFAQNADDDRTLVVSGDQMTAREPNPEDAVAAETAQVAQVEEAADFAQEAGPVETPVESRDVAAAPEPATAHGQASESTHVETVGMAISPVKLDSLEPLESALPDGSAPQTAYNEATEGSGGPLHEEVTSQGVESSERPTAPLDAAGPPENTEGDAGAVECSAEETYSNPAAAASGDRATAATDAAGVESVYLHGATEGTEDQHAAEGLHHDPQARNHANRGQQPL